MPRLTKQRRAAQAREQRKKLKQIAPDLDPTTWMLMAVETEDPEPIVTPTENEVYLPEEAILLGEPPAQPKEDGINITGESVEVVICGAGKDELLSVRVSALKEAE